LIDLALDGEPCNRDLAPTVTKLNSGHERTRAFSGDFFNVL
jgi:hypothetical protein